MNKFSNAKQRFDWTIHKFKNRSERVLGRVFNDDINAYWFTRRKNFGDLLTPALLKVEGYRAVKTTPELADIVLIGSVLQSVSPHYKGHIVGAGLINDQSVRLARARILAVRGEESRKRIRAPGDTLLGDIGLLASDLLSERCRKKFVVGLVPHYVDMCDPVVQEYRSRPEADIRIIDVSQSPIKVIRQIDECDHILSSSLHGLVVADSLGIPSRWIKLWGQLGGDDFKFNDYYSALGVHRERYRLERPESAKTLSSLTVCPAPDVPSIKEKLRIALKQAIYEIKEKKNK